MIFPSSVTSITQIAAGAQHSLAFTNDGLYAWGHNSQGDLGDGTTTNRLLPVKVQLPASVTWISSLSAWGQNINGTLGDGTRNNSWVPIAIKFPKTVSAINGAAAGTFHSLAVTNDGLYAWGTDLAGQLGTTITKSKITPTKVPGEDNAASVGAGEYFSVALHYEKSFRGMRRVTAVARRSCINTPRRRRINRGAIESPGSSTRLDTCGPLRRVWKRRHNNRETSAWEAS